MINDPVKISVEEMYGDWGLTEEAIYAKLDQSFHPRAPSMLFDKMIELGLTKTHLVLDIGCRDAHHSCELAQQFGCHVVGVDPVSHNIKMAKQTIAKGNLAHLVDAVMGRIEAIPCPDSSFDFIWCRDMLNHVPNLQQGFMECARVLKRGGKMLVFMTLATHLMEPQEASRLYAPLAVVPENMSTEHFENSVQGSGLEIAERSVIGSEWREWREEEGDRQTSKQLLYIARMMRSRERLIRELGSKLFENILADCYCGVYIMLGKLSPMLYILRKDG